MSPNPRITRLQGEAGNAMFQVSTPEGDVEMTGTQLREYLDDLATRADADRIRWDVIQFGCSPDELRAFLTWIDPETDPEASPGSRLR